MSLILALMFWPTEYRFLALGLLALLYAVLGAGLAGWLIHRLKRDPDPFSVMVEVLREDEAGLRAVLADGPVPDESERHAGRDVDAGRKGD